MVAASCTGEHRCSVRLISLKDSHDQLTRLHEMPIERAFIAVGFENDLCRRWGFSS
jgi:hypothetical protein